MAVGEQSGLLFKRLLLLDEVDGVMDYMALLLFIRQSLQDGLDCVHSAAAVLTAFLYCVELFTLSSVGHCSSPASAAERVSSRLPGVCIPHSLYARILLAVVLLEEGKRGYSEYCQLVDFVLRWPLFASWAPPLCSDDWIDPADEVFVESSKYTWESLVRVVRVVCVPKLALTMCIWFCRFVYKGLCLIVCAFPSFGT